ncbi:DUF2254 domain-containing protein, partial [Psychrobacter sp. 16-Bac2893]
MTKHAEDNLFNRLSTSSLKRLRQFFQLWSLKTLTNLPDRLTNLWKQLIGSYWFIPTACVLVGILLAPILVTIDEHFDRDMVREI